MQLQLPDSGLDQATSEAVKRKRKHTHGSREGDDPDDLSHYRMFFPNREHIDQDPPRVPPRPTSQRAATMAVEPQEDSIDQFIAVSGYASRLDAVKYLKARNNNLEQALNSFFENEDVDKELESTKWDETAWVADREGNQNLHPIGASPTPTRGPSPAPNYQGPYSKAQEDAEFQAALAASQGDVPYGQELGPMPSDRRENKLKPATGEYGDPARWALVPTTASTSSEIVPDASIDQRTNVRGEPRFIRHLPGGEYLSALLTICHSIPLARAALLLKDHVRPSYGHDGDWWKGHPIIMPKIVNVSDGSAADEVAQKGEELVMEVQRLVAALDASNRSYISATALAETDAMCHFTRHYPALKAFLTAWESAAAQHFLPAEHPSTFIFRTVVRQAHVDNNDSDDEAEAEFTTDPADLLNVLDLPVNIPEGSKRDLSQELDNLLWGTDGESSATKNSCIESAADVIVIRAYQQNPEQNKDLRLEVPPELYIDKYMDDYFTQTVELRRQLRFGRDKIQRIERIESKLMACQHPSSGKQLDAGLVLKHALGHYNGEHRRAAEKEAQQNGRQLNGTGELEETESLQHDDLAAKLDKAIQSIDEKLQRLSLEKEKTRRVLAEISKQPVTDPEERYSLRGISTKPNTTYILRPSEPDNDGNSVEERVEGDNTPEGMQWWRIEYEPNATGARITKTKMPDYDVLRAAELEHSSALLVYASARAANISLLNQADAEFVSGLPGPLQDFIHTDNQLFEAEKEAAAREAEASIPFSLPQDFDDRKRRVSADSTLVNADYESDATDPDNTHFSRDFAPKPGFYENDTTHPREGGQTPVHEIHLDEHPQSGADTEMVERVHQSLIPGLEVGRTSGTSPGSSDVYMTNSTSQDTGIVGGPGRMKSTDEQESLI